MNLQTVYTDCSTQKSEPSGVRSSGCCGGFRSGVSALLFVSFSVLVSICDAFLLNEAYVADSKVEQQAFICVKGVVW